MPPRSYDLTSLDLHTIRLALWGTVDMEDYIAQVMIVCAKLGIDEPPWFQNEGIRKQVDANAEIRQRFRTA